MIVLDASILANAIADDGADGSVARSQLATAGSLHAPDLVDVETFAVLRKRWLGRTLSEDRFVLALQDLSALELRRYPALPLLGRAHELRANVTAYDAMYVALAEALGCPLVTGDRRLAQAAGVRCQVVILGAS